MNHKENKKNAVLAAFQEHESNTYQALYTLLKDTTCLKDYTAVAYSILQEVYGTAYTAFDAQGMQVQGVPQVYSPRSATDWNIHNQQSPSLQQKSSSGRGFFRTLSGAFRSRKTDSANTEEAPYSGNGHSAFDNMSMGTGEETHASVVPAAGAAGRYGVYTPGGYT
eukprot:evm.model.scf_343.1 EVM.evm.TU.scf_343.1   scf_343:338-1997(+)